MDRWATRRRRRRIRRLHGLRSAGSHAAVFSRWLRFGDGAGDGDEAGPCLGLGPRVAGRRRRWHSLRSAGTRAQVSWWLRGSETEMGWPPFSRERRLVQPVAVMPRRRSRSRPGRRCAAGRRRRWDGLREAGSRAPVSRWLRGYGAQHAHMLREGDGMASDEPAPSPAGGYVATGLGDRDRAAPGARTGVGPCLLPAAWAWAQGMGQPAEAEMA